MNVRVDSRQLGTLGIVGEEPRIHRHSSVLFYFVVAQLCLILMLVFVYFQGVDSLCHVLLCPCIVDYLRQVLEDELILVG